MENLFLNIALMIFSGFAAFFGFNYLSASFENATFQNVIHGKSDEDFWPGGILLAFGIAGIGKVFGLFDLALWLILGVGSIIYVLAAYSSLKRYYHAREDSAGAEKAIYDWNTKKFRNLALVKILVMIGFISGLIWLIIRAIQ